MSTRFLRRFSSRSQLIESLESRTFLSADLVALSWKGADTTAAAGHFVLQIDGVHGTVNQQLQSVNDQLGGSAARYHATRHLGSDGLFLLESGSQESQGQLKIKQAEVLLGKMNGFRFVEPDFHIEASATIPNDPFFSLEWGLNNTGQTVNGTTGTPDADIDAPEAWDLTTGSSSVVAAVIDTGIEYTHPDLIANVWTNPGEIAGNGIDDDGNGYIDDVHGWDFVNNDNNPIDDNGHGTHVAGTIGAAGNNGVGVTGVNWHTSLMALKVLDATGSGNSSQSIAAINYATMMRNRGINIRVENASWGGSGFSQALMDAISANRDAGVLFVAAAGNNAANNDTTGQYPANYNVDNIISVAATDQNDQLASFSNYGQTQVDLAAPGVNIASTYTGGQYVYLNGTSMATPHVTGVAALAFSYLSTATYAQVKTAILNSVDHLASLTGKVATGGRLNAFNTLNLLAGTPTVTAPAAPSALAATATSRTTINLAFTDNASNEDGFVIQRSLDNANWTSIATLGPAAGTGTRVTYTDSGLTRNTRYYYRVRAFNSAGSFGYSNTASAKTFR